MARDKYGAVLSLFDWLPKEAGDYDWGLGGFLLGRFCT
ncbi:MAG: hypothetical protein ACI9CF_000601 [Candidatus Omnitrophota bacterium]|jgi:hypothetical protein